MADGVVNDPRQCTYTAEGDPTILYGKRPGGSCTGPNCLDAIQAAAIDKIWDGPRNHDGRPLWHAWFKDVPVGALLVLGPGVPTGTISAGNAVAWDHKDLTFSPQNLYSTRALASANPLGEPSPIALEDEFELANGPGASETTVATANWQNLLTNFHNGPKHGKIIMWQGGADQDIYTEDSIEIYREIATLVGGGTTDFTNTQSWFRYYIAPGVGHCGNGVGASPLAVTLPDGQFQIFDDLVNWVENGVVPQSAGDSTHLGILASGPGTYGTRPICPWPTTQIYNGTGPTTVATSYTCGGNLDANVALLCKGLHAINGYATSNSVDYGEQGISASQCPNP